MDDGGEIIEYRVRLYAGNNFGDALSSQKTVLSTTDTWVIPAENMPSRRPVYAMVREYTMRFSSIVHAAIMIIIINSIQCVSILYNS